MADMTSNSVQYARRLYDNISEWYRNADSKAQVVLAINSAFIAFFASTVFTEPGKLRSILSESGWITSHILTCMFLSLLGSMGASIYGLWSNLYIFPKRRIKNFSGEVVNTYPLKVMWFFQFIAYLDQKKFQTTLATIEQDSELKILAEEIHVLSGKVRKKHIAVNVGFILAAFNLILFFAAARSYMIEVLAKP